MINRFAPPGATYTSKGMIFVVLSIGPTDFLGELVAECLVLDDHPSVRYGIPPGTIMRVESWTSVWEEALQIASPENRGTVSP